MTQEQGDVEAREDARHRVRRGTEVPGRAALLEQRGVSVVREVCPLEGAAILWCYAENGGMIYDDPQDA